MKLNITKEVEILKSKTVKQLKNKYLEVYGEETKSHNKQFLIKRIAWRLQANFEGGLSERARKRALAIANDADLRIRVPKDNENENHSAVQRTKVRKFSNDNRLPKPGTILTRKYKGNMLVVTVLEKGFDYDGHVYRSLTAVAEKITGTQWNGYNFFKLNKGK